MNELTSYGLTPTVESFREETPIGEKEFANVYVDIGGPDAPLVILCTHIDTKIFDWEFVGANDSGSGTATLLELARCLAERPSTSSVTYRVLFLDGEESIREQWVDPDNRYGSRYHARMLKESGEVSRTKACILLDLIGDKDLKLTTEAYSDSRLQKIFFDAAKEIGLGQYVDGPSREILDDHLSFMAVNIPSLDLIDYGVRPGQRLLARPARTRSRTCPRRASPSSVKSYWPRCRHSRSHSSGELVNLGAGLCLGTPEESNPAAPKLPRPRGNLFRRHRMCGFDALFDRSHRLLRWYLGLFKSAGITDGDQFEQPARRPLRRHPLDPLPHPRGSPSAWSRRGASCATVALPSTSGTNSSTSDSSTLTFLETPRVSIVMP